MDCYLKGNMMSIPMQEIAEDEQVCTEDIRYLLPKEIASMQKIVEDACDKMEYDKSIMYDSWPDKVSVENLALKLAKENNHGSSEGEAEHDYFVKMQLLLCMEFSYRRQRRKEFKNHLFSSRI